MSVKCAELDKKRRRDLPNKWQEKYQILDIIWLMLWIHKSQKVLKLGL